MNCEQAKQSAGQIQSSLIAYLDGEVTPSERTLIQAHLSTCTVCQQELDLLSTARSRVRSVLQRRAVDAIPSQEAWSRLERKLSEATQPSAKSEAWFSHLAPHAGRASTKSFGGVKMQKRWIFSGLMGVIALSILAIVIARNVTPVSAREILDRSYSAQATQGKGEEGILHTRIEMYQNLCARLEDQGGAITSVMDSYVEPQTGYFRMVSTEAETGTILDIFAFDGAHIYNGNRSVDVKPDQPEGGPSSGQKQIVCDQPFGPTNGVLTVYSSSQSRIASGELPRGVGVETNEELFQKMHKDPNAKLLGEETWLDGRKVYVVRSWQPVKAVIEGSTELPMGWVVSYFDRETYKIVESRATIERDGKDLLVYSYRVLADELLPAGSYHGWDLSDLQGITIMDDPDGQHVKPLLEVISEQELASHTESAYLLSSIPDGITLEISAAPRQPKGQPFLYTASYRGERGDFLMIESVGMEKIQAAIESSDESYTTSSGLTLRFLKSDKAGKPFTSAIVETPQGTAFVINSILRREEVKALAEKLVLVK